MHAQRVSRIGVVLVAVCIPFAAWTSLFAFGSLIYTTLDPFTTLLRGLVFCATPWVGIWFALRRKRFDLLAASLLISGLTWYLIDSAAWRESLAGAGLSLIVLLYAAGRGRETGESDA